MILKKFVCLYLIFILMAGIVYAQSSKKPSSIKLEAYKRIDDPARTEVSGIIKSVIHENTYWVHGDSGTKDRIYAIDSNGAIKSDQKRYNGTLIKGAKNKDWEEIARDDNGNLIVADIGNNCFCRKDLKIFIVKEPDPDAEEVDILFEYEVEYPKGSNISDFLFEKSLNAEALFVRNGQIYIISKSADKKTRAQLYVLENPQQGKINTLKFLNNFEFDELVTAADISDDGKQIAVLTRKSVWIFEPENEDSIFGGAIKHTKIKGGGQVEAITFSGQSLILTNEDGDLFKINVSEIPFSDKK